VRIRENLCVGAVCICWGIAHSLTLMMEVIWSFRISVYFQQTTQCYIPENRTLINHQKEPKILQEVSVEQEFLLVKIICYDKKTGDSHKKKNYTGLEDSRLKTVKLYHA
jgi:hypothetical protein